MSMLRPTIPSNAIVWSRKRAGSVANAASVMKNRAPLFPRHCEERSDEAIQLSHVKLDCFVSLAMTVLRRHPVQRAELVAVGIAQIGDVQLDAAAFADARRVLAGGGAMGEAGGMERVGGIDRLGG